jgi:hypothetical protein
LDHVNRDASVLTKGHDAVGMTKLSEWAACLHVYEQQGRNVSLDRGLPAHTQPARADGEGLYRSGTHRHVRTEHMYRDTRHSGDILGRFVDAKQALGGCSHGGGVHRDGHGCPSILS